MSVPEKITGITSIKSVGSHLDIEDHEIDLRAVASNAVSLGDVGTSLTNDQKWFILKRLHFDHLVSLAELPVQASFMIEKVEGLKIDEAVKILKDAAVEHQDDINIPRADLDLIDDLIAGAASHSYVNEPSDIKEKLDYAIIKDEKINTDESSAEQPTVFGNIYDVDYHQIVDWELQVRLEAALIAYHSPYPEVRAVVEPYDDPSIPVETIRVYIAGIIWTAIGAVINQFFAERQPGITLDASVVQIFLYPTGLILERVLPKWKFKIWKFTMT
ncbi:uncharacterized protein RJT21DRAFT_115013 [Scheffersomyces amazonensis]|uniref:uncharacterized protein n=1 Tax=Scheffersomyces amazonensis TaxID=1078765 RepID=UPI00315D0388